MHKSNRVLVYGAKSDTARGSHDSNEPAVASPNTTADPMLFQRSAL